MSLLRSNFKFIGLAAFAVALIGCGGGGTSGPIDLGGDNNPPAIVGDITNPAGPANMPEMQEIQGQLASAPLGTNPEYNVQDAESVIVTRPVSQTSSVGKAASEESAVLWVAIVPRGEDPVPGNTSPPFYEGDAVDLYICYQVFAGHLTVYRTWSIAAAGLNYTDVYTHPEAGTYEAVFPFILPYGSAGLDAVFIGAWSTTHGTSAVAIQDFDNWNSVSFNIESTAMNETMYYPTEVPDASNDNPVGCMPDYIHVNWVSDTVVYVDCEKDLSNVVLQFEDGSKDEKWDDLDVGESSTFYGTGKNFGKKITAVWVKAGCNASGDGPGYGEYFTEADSYELAMAQMVWEDSFGSTDYDYNDFVGRIRAAEMRNTSNELAQVNLTVKALARSAGYPNSWQLNVGAEFPTVADMEVVTIVNQYYHDGMPHGEQRVYFSEGGASVPVFTPLDDALVYPNGYNSANCVANTPFVEGDFAEVTIILSHPLEQGTYTPMPYAPEMRIKPVGSNNIYVLGLWTAKGDELDDNGMPYGFVVPDTYAWALELVPLSSCYDTFDYWIKWINDEVTDAPLYNWWDDTPVDANVFSRDKFN